MAQTRSLNVVISADSRGFGRAASQVDRDADRLQKRFTLVADSASGLSARFTATAGSLSSLVPLIASATPALAGLGVAAAGLGASFASAAAGAGALGAGFGASMLPILAVGKQVTSRFDAIKTAYDALKKAQQDHTEASKKAAEQAMSGLSRNEQAMARSLGRLSDLQQKVLGGASDRIFGALAGAVTKVAPALEKLAEPFDHLGDAIAGNISRIASILTNGPWSHALKAFIDSATTLVRPMTTIFIHIADIMRDIAVAALPMVQKAVAGVAHWFYELDRAATTSKIRNLVEGLVDQTRTWLAFFGQIGRLLGQVGGLFASTANRGKGFVASMTSALDRLNDFIDQMKAGTGAGGAFAARVSAAFATVKTAVQRSITAVSAWLDQHRSDINSVIQAMKRVAEFAVTTWHETLLPTIRNSVRAIGPIVSGLADTVRGLVRLVSGLLSGDWVKAWDGAKEATRGALRAIGTYLKTSLANLAVELGTLGPKFSMALSKGIMNSWKAIANGITHAVQSAVTAVPGMIGGALKSLGGKITSGITSGLGKIPGIGDGLGMSAFSGGNSLMGARSNMAPVAGIAARFGLHTSSGLRPGAITTSGNVSYHSSGEALDEAGSPSGMMGFFRFMKNTMGGRLAELIYGPGRVGIKDGRPFNFGPALNAQHMDHVHVAIDTGAPGVGDGLGRFTATSYGPPWGGIQGTGVTATGVNLKGNPHTYGVAVDPRVIPLGSKLRISPNPFNYGGTFTAFDTGGAIKGNRIDFYDWRGRSAQLGWGSRSVTVSTVTNSSGDTLAPSKGKPVAPGMDRGGLGHVDPSYVNGGDAPDADSYLTPRPPRTAGDLARSRPRKGYLPGDPIPQPADTPAAQGPLAALQDRLDEVDLQERAGVIDSTQAAALRDHLRAQALNGYFGQLGDRDRLQVQGDARQAMLDLADVSKGISDLADQISQLRASVDEQTEFAKRVSSTDDFQLRKSLADLVSGQIVGYGVAGRSFTPGTGVEYAY